MRPSLSMGSVMNVVSLPIVKLGLRCLGLSCASDDDETSAEMTEATRMARSRFTMCHFDGPTLETQRNCGLNYGRGMPSCTAGVCKRGIGVDIGTGGCNRTPVSAGMAPR